MNRPNVIYCIVTHRPTSRAFALSRGYCLIPRQTDASREQLVATAIGWGLVEQPEQHFSPWLPSGAHQLPPWTAGLPESEFFADWFFCGKCLTANCHCDEPATAEPAKVLEMAWIHEGPKCGRQYALHCDSQDTGWRVIHCGHPTALWPYYIQMPDGRSVISPSGVAFRLVKDAKAAAEQLAAGQIELIRMIYRDGSRLAAAYTGGDYQYIGERICRLSQSGEPYRTYRRSGA